MKTPKSRLILLVLFVLPFVAAVAQKTEGDIEHWSFPAIELKDSTITAVLRDSIVPIAVKNGFDKYRDQMILKIYRTDKLYSVWPVDYFVDLETFYARTHNVSELKREKQYKNAEFYGIEVGDVPFLVIDMTDGESIKPSKGFVSFYYDQACEVNSMRPNVYRYSVGGRGTFLNSFSIGGVGYLEGYYPKIRELE